MQQWNISAVVDGEVVVLDEDGKSNFGALQNWRSEADGEIYFYVFDLLWMNGKDLMQIPLFERRNLLKQIVPENGIIRLSQNFEVSGTAFFETVKKMGLEGIIAKKADSLYSAGNRSREWLKIKANKRQEMIIGGYTKNDDSSKSFSSLFTSLSSKKNTQKISDLVGRPALPMPLVSDTTFQITQLQVLRAPFRERFQI